MILVVPRATSPCSFRQAEYDFCLDANQKSGLFSRVEMLGPRPQFREIFDCVNLNYYGETIVLANADITFDESLHLAGEIDGNSFYALTRWESATEFYGRKYSQDAWIFRAPIRRIEATFTMGVPGCDNRLAALACAVGYSVSNPSLTIRCYHHHKSRVRTYSEKDRVQGRYVYLDPIELNTEKINLAGNVRPIA